MDNTERVDRLDIYIAEGRLIRHAWTRVEDGRELACLLAALSPEAGASSSAWSCPAEVMPAWLAELTVWLDDAGSLAAWPGVVRRYAALARRWGVLTPEAWERARIACLIAIVEEARTHCPAGSAGAIDAIDGVLAWLRRGAPESERDGVEARAAAASEAAWASAARAAEAVAAAGSAARAAISAADGAAAAAAGAVAWAARAAAAARAAEAAAEEAAADRMATAILDAIETEIGGAVMAKKKCGRPSEGLGARVLYVRVTAADGDGLDRAVAAARARGEETSASSMVRRWVRLGLRAIETEGEQNGQR